MSKVQIICAQCGETATKEAGGVSRSRSLGAPLFCSRQCSANARRVSRTDAEKRAAKAAYDVEYRNRDVGARKAAKAEYHRRTYNPMTAAGKRKARMPSHVEYCRRPEYRKWKAEYDRKYLARKQFGPFGEAAIILNQLEAEIFSRASWIEIRATNGTLNKHQQRRREYERQTQRR